MPYVFVSSFYSGRTYRIALVAPRVSARRKPAAPSAAALVGSGAGAPSTPFFTTFAGGGAAASQSDNDQQQQTQGEDEVDDQDQNNNSNNNTQQEDEYLPEDGDPDSSAASIEVHDASDPQCGALLSRKAPQRLTYGTILTRLRHEWVSQNMASPPLPTNNSVDDASSSSSAVLQQQQQHNREDGQQQQQQNQQPPPPTIDLLLTVDMTSDAQAPQSQLVDAGEAIPLSLLHDDQDASVAASAFKNPPTNSAPAMYIFVLYKHAHYQPMERLLRERTEGQHGQQLSPNEAMHRERGMTALISVFTHFNAKARTEFEALNAAISEARRTIDAYEESLEADVGRAELLRDGEVARDISVSVDSLRQLVAAVRSSLARATSILTQFRLPDPPTTVALTPEKCYEAAANARRELNTSTRRLAMAGEIVAAVSEQYFPRFDSLRSLPDAYPAAEEIARRRLDLYQACTRVQHQLSAEARAIQEDIAGFVQRYGNRFPQNVLRGLDAPIPELHVADEPLMHSVPVALVRTDGGTQLLRRLGLLPPARDSMASMMSNSGSSAEDRSSQNPIAMLANSAAAVAPETFSGGAAMSSSSADTSVNLPADVATTERSFAAAGAGGTDGAGGGGGGGGTPKAEENDRDDQQQEAPNSQPSTLRPLSQPDGTGSAAEIMVSPVTSQREEEQQRAMTLLQEQVEALEQQRDEMLQLHREQQARVELLAVVARAADEEGGARRECELQEASEAAVIEVQMRREQAQLVRAHSEAHAAAASDAAVAAEVQRCRAMLADADAAAVAERQQLEQLLEEQRQQFQRQQQEHQAAVAALQARLEEATQSQTAPSGSNQNNGDGDPQQRGGDEQQPGAGELPDTRSICCKFLIGGCGRGNNCVFAHALNGNPCNAAERCRFKHNEQPNRNRAAAGGGGGQQWAAHDNQQQSGAGAAGGGATAGGGGDDGETRPKAQVLQQSRNNPQGNKEFEKLFSLAISYKVEDALMLWQMPEAREQVQTTLTQMLERAVLSFRRSSSESGRAQRSAFAFVFGGSARVLWDDGGSPPSESDGFVNGRVIRVIGLTESGAEGSVPRMDLSCEVHRVG